MSRRTPTEDGGYEECFSIEEAILEKSRLEALQQLGPLSVSDEATLSILSQWLAHYASGHAHQA